MVNVGLREPLRGEVEIDDAWVGGRQAGLRRSRQLRGRKAALVVVAVEKRGRASGHTRMVVIPDFKKTTLGNFVKKQIAPGSTIYTDSLKSFTGLQEAGFNDISRPQPILRSDLAQKHQIRSGIGGPSHRQPPAMAHWTYHGVRCDQLKVYLVYLDKFVFRHNRRKQPMAAFQTLLGLGTG
jgi:transposase-like protein